MELKFAFDSTKEHTVETIITGVSLGLLGLITISGITGLGWLGKMDLFRLTLYTLLTLFLGTYLHEAYHFWVAKLLGYKSSLKLFPVASFVPLDNFTKWGALGIILAPATDLTLISALIIAFLPNPLNPIFIIFLVGNLAGSANDVLQAYYIFKLAGYDSLIRFNANGFEIWE